MNRNKIIIVISSFILLTIFLFSKATTSKKEFIGQNEYSVYSKSYVYGELVCIFSLFDCSRAGVIYLYDEIEGKVLESVSTGRITAMESLKWHQSDNTIYFTASDIVIKNNEWTLPRPLKKSIKSENVDLVNHPFVEENSDKDKVDNSIFIKDSADYSVRFLKEMEKGRMKNVSLIDNLLILEQNDTVSFPKTPRIGKKTVLTAKKNQLAIALTIHRINQTTIDYKLEMIAPGNASYNHQGQAHLQPYFYLGEETDKSSISGVSYLSTEFSNSQDSCYTYIRIGIEENSGAYLLGKIIKNCNGKIEDIGLNNFPTLVEK